MQDESVLDWSHRMFSELQRCISVGDYIKFSNETYPMGLGEVVDGNIENVKVKIFLPIDSATLRSYSLPPLDPITYPLASQDEMVEVYQTVTYASIPRCNINDIAFIVPISEVESGRFFLSGARNTYVIRLYDDGRRMKLYKSSFYFSRHLIEPLGVRLFHSLNTLSDHMRRSLFHRPEAATTSQNF
jgi:hypothetical protein